MVIIFGSETGAFSVRGSVFFFCTLSRVWFYFSEEPPRIVCFDSLKRPEEVTVFCILIILVGITLTCPPPGLSFLPSLEAKTFGLTPLLAEPILSVDSFRLIFIFLTCEFYRGSPLTLTGSDGFFFIGAYSNCGFCSLI